MKVYKGYQFRSAVEELILKVAKHFNKKIRITWSDQISTAGIAKHGNIIIANVRDDARMTHRDLIKWVGFGVHEILHAIYTDFDVRGNTRYEDALHNAVEDAWIEHTGIAHSLTGNIEPLLADLLDNMVTEALNTVDDWADPRQYPFVLAVYLRNHAKIKVPLAEGLEPIFEEAKRRLNSAKSTNDTYAIAHWVYEQLAQLDDPEEDASESQPEGQQGDETGEGDGDGQGNQQAAQEGSGKPQKVGKARRIDAGDAVNPEPSLELDDSQGSSGTYSEAYIKREYDLGQYNAWADLTVNVPAKLRFEVRRLFDNSGLDEFTRNRRSGSVDVHALPSHQYNDKLFKLRRSEDGVDTAVVVVVDASGSMFADGGYDNKGNPLRMLNALRTSAALIDTLRRAQVATSVMAFGDVAVVVKDFNTSVPKALDQLSRMKDFGSTNDYIAVRGAHTMLLKRPEQRKICFVITDGEGDKWSTRQQCEIGARLGITTIGIGIDLNVGDAYPQNVTVSNVSELGAVSFNKIKLAA